jgi:Fe2+ or Zn2+ uptake regulation protein
MTSLIQQARERLHSQGGRMTAQRRLILEILEGDEGYHPTAEEVYAQARQREPRIHLSTVYRTLRWLHAEGLVSSRWFHEERRQERFDPNSPSEHHHFVCLSCQEVIEFLEPLMTEGVRRRFENQHGALVEKASLQMYGWCSQCREAKDRSVEDR